MLGVWSLTVICQLTSEDIKQHYLPTYLCYESHVRLTFSGGGNVHDTTNFTNEFSEVGVQLPERLAKPPKQNKNPHLHVVLILHERSWPRHVSDQVFALARVGGMYGCGETVAQATFSVTQH